MRLLLVSFLLFGICFAPCWCFSQTAGDVNRETKSGDALLTEYFAAETAKLTERALADVRTLDDWTERREQYRQQLQEMLSLDPMPERTDLNAVVTGSVESDEFIVENLHFESMPGLYVSGNLYRPKQVREPLPAVLYVCGHGGVKKAGVSYGNKANYQHHGAWFARNGYLCLVIDTIQLGEIEGIHHGTYRYNMWWWNNRGYTPAGVEAWNCIRAIDYLQSRSEVDPDRIGVTGRSGGGAYSWWVAALDERIKVAVPVAGITSLKNHVVDGCVEGHCDCMFMVNTYRWDYSMVAALVAPRPLLISNTDKDSIFPLDGVVDVHLAVRRIYDLYEKPTNLGLQITEGPHKDTQELRVHAFRWFNRFLRQDESLIQTVATPFFDVEQLKVFDELPTDQRVTTIHESFVSKVAPDTLPESKEALQESTKTWMKSLREKTFRGWPETFATGESEHESLAVKVVASAQKDGLKITAADYLSQSPYRLAIYIVEPIDGTANRDAAASDVKVIVLDELGWQALEPAFANVFPNRHADIDPDSEGWEVIRNRVKETTHVYVAPRGVGPTAWSADEKRRTHIRRRFMLLGQTAAAMQIFDVCRALAALDKIESLADRPRQLVGRGEAATWALYASLFADRLSQLTLIDLPASNREAPDLLNVSRFVETPHLLLMSASRVKQVQLLGSGDSEAAFQTLLASPLSDNISFSTPQDK